jgi:SET domain-containing protein
MTKEAILEELANNTWVKLQPSPTHGIGVFAVRDIPEGCTAMFSQEMGEWVTVPRSEVNALPQHAKELVENFCLYDEQHYFIPAQGFKSIDLSLFLNHSEKPNIISVNDGEYFKAVQSIKRGEELLIDYGSIVDE